MSGKGAPVKHGALKFWQKGILPPYRRALADHADQVIQAIIDDLGGDPTAAQGVMLGQLRKLLIFQALIDKWLSKQKDIINRAGNLPPALNNFYLAALNQSCRIVKDLGLERVTIADNLEDYLKKKAQAAQEAQITPATSPRQGKEKKPICARIKSDPEAQGGES
ncbi:MAG: hypothetical protein ABII93_06115 [Chrysiogenia bacterium]